MFDAPTFADPTIIGNGDVRQVSYGNDTGLYAEFRMENVHMEFLSEQEGRPIYEQRPFIRLYVPGDKTKVVDRPVVEKQVGDMPSDPQRFPAQWAAFKAGQQAVANGTPLAEWPQMTTSQVRELGTVNIFTVEQLAAVHDGALDGLGHGGRAIRDSAIRYLAAAKDNSFHTQQAAEIEALKAQVAALTASQELTQEAKRGPGRPKKEDNDGE